MTYGQSSQASPENALPGHFIEMLGHYPLFDGLPDVLMNTAPDVSVRVNPGKDVSVDAEMLRVPWCADGFYLPQRLPFTFDPALHQGLYYVQDASSMAISHIAKTLSADGRPLRWLDICAAPGGKTTAAISALPEGSVVIANEYDPRRAAALAENLERWGYGRTAVTVGDTKAYRRLEGFFDVVAVDAPCSGEGMMRKEPQAVHQWTPALVQQCAALQQQIADNAWQALRPGGYMIYSTCTFNVQENERNVARMIERYDARSIDPGLSAFPGVAGAVEGTACCARFIPGRVRGEGLFVAVLQKPGDAAVQPCRRSFAKTSVAPAKWLSDNYIYAEISGSLHAVPEDAAAVLATVAKHTKCISLGIEAGVIKGRDILPSYALAHAVDLNADAFHQAEVDYHTAIAYLRGEPVVLPDSPRGIILLTFRGRPLAFAKNIGNRANNLVPASRRIISPHIPDDEPIVLSV